VSETRTSDEEKSARACRLKELRESVGMERDVFAGRLGISYVTLRNAENGYQTIGRRTLAEAERLAASILHGGNVPDASCTPVPAADHLDDRQLVDIIRASRDEAVLSAAEGVAKAIGISTEEAIAMIVRKHLAVRQ
jgi:transcriptional regulator with XRE-family HTH domain